MLLKNLVVGIEFGNHIKHPIYQMIKQALDGSLNLPLFKIQVNFHVMWFYDV